MQIVLPSGLGWSAIPLFNTVWGRIGVVAKCGFSPAGAQIPSSIRLADDLANSHIAAEADTALFKSHVDFHMQGVTGEAIEFAEYRLNGEVVVKYGNNAEHAPLFGYEPRDRRISLNAQGSDFDLLMQGADLFRSVRRSSGYTAAAMQELPSGLLHINVHSRTGANTTLYHDLTLSLPRLTLHVWIHEAGPDREPYWCAHASTPLKADTLTLTPQGPEILWRGSLSSAAVPLKLIRKLQIKKDT